MCRFKPANSLFSPFSFPYLFLFPSVQHVTTWVQTSQISFFFLPFSFSFLCMLELVHVKYIWVHRTISMFTNSFLYCHPLFFLGKPLHSYSKVPLMALNSGGQPLSWSIIVFPFNHLPQPHLGVQPGDQIRLAQHAQH